ncbi:Thioredoxin F-type like [Actinidia chinensis var. chinensis]|uniref:Thioredoxin F-type like n=1 Tax=Actinidia chinensis var. chinensis TaxID=1590841 RepID=A0A2R6PKS2_ACTCC|nr:Thioredoxin F-type like [Actinidia chinensis var. chinensis]
MAHQLQISLSTTCSSSSFRSPPPWPTQRSITVFSEVFPKGFGKRIEKIGVRSGERKQSPSVRVRSSLDTAGSVVVTVGQVTEVNKDTFWPLVKAAGDKTVVLDMYTQWCGPCKVMAPKFRELSEKYLDVVFLKLDCNQDNRPLAKELGIRVVPTFKILKDSKIVKEVTGAKFDDLVGAIETVRSSC